MRSPGSVAHCQFHPFDDLGGLGDDLLRLSGWFVPPNQIEFESAPKPAVIVAVFPS
jgi:hypothetical protein